MKSSYPLGEGGEMTGGFHFGRGEVGKHPEKTSRAMKIKRHSRLLMHPNPFIFTLIFTYNYTTLWSSELHDEGSACQYSLIRTNKGYKGEGGKWL